MATRASKGAARPRGGTATRTRSPARSGGSARGRAAARRRTTRRGRQSGRRYAAPAPSSNPFVILAGWVVALLAAIWMGLAHTVGTTARAVGDNARDLDPMHRRDGVGLAALCAAIGCAVAIWWDAPGPLRPVSLAIRGLFGSASWTLPILLSLLAWRYLRHPDRNADTARMVIGWIALLIGALGLVHVASGTPGLTAGVSAIRSSGGLIGYTVSAPLVAVVTKWAAVHRVPERIADIRNWLLRFIDADAAAEAAAAGTGGTGGRPQAKLARRRSDTLEVGARDRAYDTPLLDTLFGR